jgi:hypothetical protein
VGTLRFAHPTTLDASLRWHDDSGYMAINNKKHFHPYLL